MNRKLLIILITLISLNKVFAQGDVGIKTNLFYGGYTYTPNLGVEIGVGSRTTLELSGGYNPWNLDSKGGMKKMVHFLVQPELRYFFGSSFKGHFLGIHGLYSQYNIGGNELPLLFGKGSQAFRYEGFAYGGGIAYGYQFPLGRHWSLELSLGVGMMQMDYGKYDCVNCGKMLSSGKKTYLGPTKAAISIIYIFKGRERKAMQRENITTYPVIQPNEKLDSVSTQPILVSNKQPESITEIQKIPATCIPTSTPRVSTADSLAKHYSFVVPASEFGRSRKVTGDELFNPDMPLNMGKGLSTPQQNSVEQFIADNEEGAILINFSRAESVIDRYYKDNNMALVTLASVLKKIQTSPDSRVDRVIVAGFASPDGLLSTNDRLAWERANAMRNFICANSTVSEDSVQIYNGSEDWRGLRKLVEESDIEAKSEILRIIDRVPVISGREGQLMRLADGRPYRYMVRYFFPKLRNAAYIKVYYTDKR